MVTQKRKLLTYQDLLIIFLKAGMTFGGGVSILSELEDELVTHHKVVSKEDFLATYALGRIVPSGTMTALAVAYGYQFGSWLGTVIALVGLILPAFVITISLTVAYVYIKNASLLDLLPVTLLPAALALIVVAAFKLGKNVFRSSLDAILIVAAFVGTFVFNLNPTLLMVVGGILGTFLFGRSIKKHLI
ncbi:MAG: chromate transporter [Hassallia sp.]